MTRESDKLSLSLIELLEGYALQVFELPILWSSITRTMDKLVWREFVTHKLARAREDIGI